MTDVPTVFRATYSTVAVYEFMCKNVAVMRRRDDGYVNATQILKVAEFPKAQRTRILEREVQTGVHEKIQGGYGKYQGTWIPLDRGKELARRYDVFELLSPLLLFQRGPTTPPLAPKHPNASTYRTKTPKEPKLTKKQKQLLEAQQQGFLPSPMHHAGQTRPNVGYKQPPPTYSQPSLPQPPSLPALPPLPPGLATPSVYQNKGNYDFHRRHLQQYQTQQQSPHTANRAVKIAPRTKKRSRSSDDTDQHSHLYHHDIDAHHEDLDELVDDDQASYDSNYDSDEPYDVQLLRHFISGDARVPSLLLHPPSDLDFNIIIDDEGHTSLHWAAAIGHLKIVKLLLHHGADVSRVNYKGQTALIRSVLFTNNFERRCFPHMLDMLRKTIFNIDKKDQTVFHHIAATAGWKGKVHASRYYMDCLMEKIRANKEDLVQILNVQDVYGDTALNIASRVGNKKLVRVLVEAGANPQLANELGKRPQDYMLEFDGNQELVQQQNETEESVRKKARLRVDNALKNVTDDSNNSNPLSERHSPSPLDYDTSNTATKHRHYLQGTATPVIRDVSKIVDEFINSYERDQEYKGLMLRDSSIELQMIQKRLEVTNRTKNQLEFSSKAMDAVEREAKELQLQLHQILEYTQMKQLQQLVDQYQKSSVPSSSSITSSPASSSSSPSLPSSPLPSSSRTIVVKKPMAMAASPSTFLSNSPSISSSTINNRTSSARTSTLYAPFSPSASHTPSSPSAPSSSSSIPGLPSPSLPSPSLLPALTQSITSLVTSSAKKEMKDLLGKPDQVNDKQSLSTELTSLVEQRQQLIKEIVTLQSRIPNKRYQDYKRLISMCCNVNYENVDLMLSPLLASFEQSVQNQ